MQPFTVVTGIAAPLPRVNVDTDLIIPKQYLRVTTREGLGKGAFNDLRYREDGSENPDFVLNQEPYRRAQILVAGANFGCGSSREHAPWALADFGIRAILAPSFADIFRNNCFKNGLLPVALAQPVVDQLMEDARGGNSCTMTVDLPNQTITRSNGETIAFDVDPFWKTMLIEGLDEIGLTLTHAAEIAGFEERQRAAQPWLWA